jgi:transcriptional regulator with XRE-family HTH domain
MAERRTGPNARKPSPLASAVAAQLRAELDAAGVTMVELARRTDLPRSSLIRVLTDERTIDMTQYALVCAALEVDVVEVMARAAERVNGSAAPAPPGPGGDRLHAAIESRRLGLGLTLSAIQAAGGPSPKWVQNLRRLEGSPTPRMRAPMRRLDAALGWEPDTAWALAGGTAAGA